MSNRVFNGPDAITESEKYGLKLLLKNPQLVHWIPIVYNIARHEFDNPTNTRFQYDSNLNKVLKHTTFSKFISDLSYYSDIKNIPFSFHGVNVVSIIFTLCFIYVIFYL